MKILTTWQNATLDIFKAGLIATVTQVVHRTAFLLFSDKTTLEEANFSDNLLATGHVG